jgi:peroxiredoxin Q/BCP
MIPRTLAMLAFLALGACARNESTTDKPAAPAKEIAPMLLTDGSPAPAIRVTAHDGTKLDLSKLGKPAVVYFYPKDDTPGCTIEAKEIRDLWKEIQGTGAVVVGVSTDGQASHQAFADKYALPFLLVPDEDHTVAKAFGVTVTNGKAARVSFVLDALGRVTKVFPKVTPAGHGAELLAALPRNPGP